MSSRGRMGLYLIALMCFVWAAIPSAEAGTIEYLLKSDILAELNLHFCPNLAWWIWSIYEIRTDLINLLTGRITSTYKDSLFMPITI